MRTFSVAGFGLFATIGCASSGGTPAGTTESLDIRGPRSSMTIETRREAFVTSDTIFTSATRVLDAIPRAMASLNFKVENTDYASLSVTTPPTAVRHQLDGRRVSRFLTCGASAAGNNADLYFVSMRVQTSVLRISDRASVLRTTISASARPPDNGASSVRCESSGLLERRVLELVAAEALSTH